MSQPALHPGLLSVPAWHTIVGIAHQEGAPPQARADTLVKPGIQDFVEEDVREQRADHPTLGGTLVRIPDPAVFHDTGS